MARRATMPSAVQFDPAVINQKHAYAIFASLIDGTTSNTRAARTDHHRRPLERARYAIAVPAYAQTRRRSPARSRWRKRQRCHPRRRLRGHRQHHHRSPGHASGHSVADHVAGAVHASPMTHRLSTPRTYVAMAGVVDGTTLYNRQVPSPIAPGATVALTVAKTNVVIPGPAASASPGASGTPGASVVPSGQPSTPRRPRRPSLRDPRHPLRRRPRRRRHRQRLHRLRPPARRQQGAQLIADSHCYPSPPSRRPASRRAPARPR